MLCVDAMQVYCNTGQAPPPPLPAPRLMDHLGRSQDRVGGRPGGPQQHRGGTPPVTEHGREQKIQMLFLNIYDSKTEPKPIRIFILPSSWQDIYSAS